MTTFSALVASSEGTHPVLVEADTEAEAKEKLELDFGKGSVRTVQIYSADNAIDPDMMRLRDEEISEFSRGQSRRSKADKPEKKQTQGMEFQAMTLVLVSFAVPALAIFLFGKPFLSWLREFLGRLPQ